MTPPPNRWRVHLSQLEEPFISTSEHPETAAEEAVEELVFQRYGDDPPIDFDFRYPNGVECITIPIHPDECLAVDKMHEIYRNGENSFITTHNGEKGYRFVVHVELETTFWTE